MNTIPITRPLPKTMKKIPQSMQMTDLWRKALITTFDRQLFADLTVPERDFLLQNITPPHRTIRSFGYLPYDNLTKMDLSDAIIKKLGLRKFYIGPRRGRRGSAALTLKGDAVAVSLYCKTYEQRESLWKTIQNYTDIA